MTGREPVFSESWHRVAGLRASLRPMLRIRRQFFRGEKWFVLQDQFNNHFVRFRPAVYEFIARLDPRYTIEQVWQLCLEINPHEAPTQNEVIRVLSQLHQSNLLQFDVAPDNVKLFERRMARSRREVRARWLNVLFWRFPIFDPDRFLNACRPFLSPLFGRIGAMVWLVTVAAAIKVLIDHFDQVRLQTEALLAPGNIALLYAGIVFTKALHEFGHAFACKRFGGEVHVIGIMLLIFSPVPYVDATASWAFRSRWQRIFVGAAGMIVEMFFAALATFVWANTGAGTLHALAYNIMFIASVSTLLFNINPLLRFDGYYMFSDLIEIPNLALRAQEELRHWFERIFCGLKTSRSMAHSRGESIFLAAYGVIAAIYRTVLSIGIILFLGNKFLGIGVILAVLMVILWGAMPLLRFIRYVVSEPRFQQCRPRLWATAGGPALVALLVVAFLPVHSAFRAPGVLKAANYADVFNQTSGYVEEVCQRSGTFVRTGDPLIRLKSPELVLDLAAARAERDEVLAMQGETLEVPAEAEAIRERLQSVEQRITTLTEQEKALIVRARLDGLWVSPRSHDFIGSWLQRGTELGKVIGKGGFQFTAVVRQEEAARLFTRAILRADVRLHGQAGSLLPVTAERIIPARQFVLPSAALGWAGGGDIETARQDPKGVQAREPFFEIIADVGESSGVAWLHERTGRIRFVLPPEPLLRQWTRGLKQLLQKRYQL